MGNDAGIFRFRRDGREVAFALTFLSEAVTFKYADVTLGQLAVAHFLTAYE